MTNEIEVTPPEHLKALYLAAADYIAQEGGSLDRIAGVQYIRPDGAPASVFFLGIECHGKAPSEPEDNEPNANN